MSAAAGRGSGGRDPGEQLDEGQPVNLGDPQQRPDRGVVGARLEAGVVGARDAGAFRHLALAQPRLVAKPGESGSEPGKEPRLVHGGDHAPDAPPGATASCAGGFEATGRGGTAGLHPVTASMLYDLATCDHRVHLDLFGDPAMRDPASAFVEMLWREGAAHKAEVLSAVAAAPNTVDLRDAPTDGRRALTAQALDAAAPLVLGGEIAAEGLLARPDVLRLGPAGHVPGDVKAGAAADGTGRPKAAYANQVALAADVLVRTGRLAAPSGFIWDRRGEEVALDFGTVHGKRRPETLWDAYGRARDAAAAIAAGAQTRPGARAACKLCRWHGHCREALVAADDITLVPLLGPALRETLAQAVGTVTALASIDLAASTLPGGRTVFPGIGADRLARFRDRARLLADPTPGAYARQPLPLARRPVELFLDIEVDPFGNRTYLHGVVERRTHPDGIQTERFTAHFMEDQTAAEEARAFADAMAQLTAEPDAAIYYWSPYERVMYRALQARHPQVCDRGHVEALFASPHTIDLLNDVVAPMTDWPLHDHSIKTIAKHLGFRWRDAEPSGAASIEWFRRWLESKDAAVRRRIEEYNEDDCVATRVVLDGLLSLPVRPPADHRPHATIPDSRGAEGGIEDLHRRLPAMTGKPA